MSRAIELVTLSVIALGLTACGGRNCTPTPFVVTVAPTTATADHSATPPANQVTFSVSGSGGQTPSGCSGVSDPLEGSIWKVADSTDVQLTRTPSLNIGETIATCVHATSGSTLVSGTLIEGDQFQGTGTAQLTCK